MPIYTKKGDRGQTGLPGDRRASKTEPLFDLLGQLDQTNAEIGLAVSLITKPDKKLVDQLQAIQTNFLAIGACLASVNPAEAEILKNLDEETKKFENQIDQWDELLPALRNFILPGGSKAAAALHVARANARTAERLFHKFPNQPELAPISQYLNRLSDYLFQAARYVNYSAKKKDIIWKN